MKRLYAIIIVILVSVNFLTAQTTQTFNYTGSQQTFTIPSCVSSISVDLRAAEGGNGLHANNSIMSLGGTGGRLQCDFPVSPGNVLYIYVGGAGGVGTSGGGLGGYNGGGQGGWRSDGYRGGGGGGASDIRLNGTALSDRILIAGGAGGAGDNYYAYNYDPGGKGGGLTGETGWGGNSSPGQGSGFGGSANSGGAGGSWPGYCASGAGSLGLGGHACGGSLGPNNGAAGGGGGGGGYYGGGAGCWSGAGGGSSFSGVGATNIIHTQGGQSGNGVVTITYTSTAPATPGVITGSASLCANASGNYSIVPIPGATTYTWTVPTGSTINSGQGTTSINLTAGSTSGNISVTVTFPCGTSAPSTFVLTISPSPVITVGSNPASVCSGGTSTLTASGGLTYTWMPGNLTGASVVVTPLITTTYTVTGTNVQGCSSTATTTITINATPTVTAIIAAPILFTEPFTSSLGQMSTNASSNGAWAFNNTCPGAIQSGHTTPGTAMFIGSTCVYGNGALTVSGNMDSPTIAINSSGATLTFKYRINTECGASTCPYDVVTVQGSINNFVTSSTLATTTNASLTPNGTVWGTATVSLAAFANTSMKLRFNYNSIDGSTNNIDGVYIDDITVLGVPSTICAGSSVTINATGASTYAWMPGNLTGSSVVVSPFNTTTYTVTGTSAQGCTGTSTITVTVNPSPIIMTSITLPTICVGGSTTITASGAASYTWMPGNLTGSSVTVSPTATTTYTVTGTNSQGCSTNSSATVTVNGLPVVSASSNPSSICIGNSTSISATGASTYAWMPGNLSGSPVSVSPTSTTTYTVTGSDANGCTNTASTTITVNTLPTLSTSATASTICVGASTTITASGATTYAWVPGNLTGSSITVTPSVTTTYTITGTNGSGCVNTTTVTITVNALPLVSASSSPSSICAGNSVTLTGIGATSYAWMPGNLSGSPVSVSPMVTTTYSLTGTDANGCVNTALTTVTVNPTPAISATATAMVICAGASVSIAAAGALSYSWMPGNLSGILVNVSPSVTTTYTITGTNAQGCLSTTTITITVHPLPVVTANSSSAIICTGGSVTLTGGGASTYVWSNNVIDGISFVPSVTTTYMVTGTDANGCVNTATTTVTVNQSVSVTVVNTNPVICVGGSSTLIASGATSYTWMPGNLTTPSIVVSPTSTTTYTVTGTNPQGCTSIMSTTITVSATPVLTVSSSSLAVCAGTSITLSATGATSFVWSNNVTNAVPFVPSATTTYTVTGSDPNGCSATASITVTVNANPVVALGADIVLCSGTTVLNAGNMGSTYLWNNASTTQTITVTASGSYSVVVTNVNNCSGSDVIQVSINPSLVVALGPDVMQCGGTALLDPGSIGSTYMWSNASTTQSITVAASGTFIVVVTDINGCMGTDTVNVTIYALPNVTASASSLLVCVDDASVTLSGLPSGGVWWGPGVTASLLSPTAAGVGMHTAYYSYTDVNGCEGMASVNVQVNACVGFVENALANGVSVYPNPNNGSFTLSVNANVADLTIKITDMQGRVVYASVENKVNAGFVKQISLDTQSSGMYLMHIITNGEQQTKKISVQK